MGTSASSNGPNRNVPFDPPWLDDIVIPRFDPPEGTEDDSINGLPKQEQDSTPIPLAPARRFGYARRALGEYARSGNKEALSKALGHYSRVGMGGANQLAHRMRVSTRSAAALGSFLKSARDGDDPKINEWVASLTQRNAEPSALVDEIVSMVTPQGGSVDESNCRISMETAITGFLDLHPSIDLLKLSDENIWSIIKSFLANEAYRRMCLDIGQCFERTSLSAVTMVDRINEMRSYLLAEISAQIESLKGNALNASIKELNKILETSLTNTFLVYEGTI